MFAEKCITHTIHCMFLDIRSNARSKIIKIKDRPRLKRHGVEFYYNKKICIRNVSHNHIVLQQLATSPKRKVQQNCNPTPVVGTMRFPRETTEFLTTVVVGVTSFSDPNEKRRKREAIAMEVIQPRISWESGACNGDGKTINMSDENGIFWS